MMSEKEMREIIYDAAWGAVEDESIALSDLINTVIEETGIKAMISEELWEVKEEFESRKDSTREEIDELKDEHGIDYDEFDTGVEEIDSLESDWDLYDSSVFRAEGLIQEL